MTTLAFSLFEISLRFVWDRFLICSVTQIPFGIFWWYLVEMYNRTRRHVMYKNDNSGFLIFGVISHCFVWNRFRVCSVTNTHGNILMVLGRNVEQNETTCRIQEYQLCLSYFWCYLPLFCFWNWFYVHSNTLGNILMVFYRNVEQAETMCHIQEWQLCLSYFLCYHPLLYLTVIISRKPFGIFLWYLVEM